MSRATAALPVWSRQSLHTGWTLRAASSDPEAPAEIAERDIPAAVPGCVHTDLLAEGLIPDPYVADNELKLWWIGRMDWVYRCVFSAEQELLAAPRIDLVCDGLDTIASLELNGQPLGSADNMHRRWRFDAKPLLRAGENELVIHFAAPAPHIEAQAEHYGPLPFQGCAPEKEYPHNFMRKMACNFGWDWGPIVPTAGVWRPIALEAWGGARVSDIRPTVAELDAEVANVRIAADMEIDGDASDLTLHYRITDPEGAVAAEGEFDSPVSEVATTDVTIAKPQWWWPIGHGEQPLYGLTITVCDATGRALHSIDRKLGLRTVELDTSPDPQPIDGLGQGEQMTLKVNGKPIYCKGANWIPDDAFPSRIAPQRYRLRVEQAAAANMNMLRVWGGGIFEDEAFFAACDELGVMVWQDFLFACALYPEEEPYRSSVEAEARDNIARLASHPSLVLWNGGNECIYGTFDWSEWFQSVRKEGKRTWGLGYWLDLLPDVLRELDPGRPYWANSPYSGSMDRHPNDNAYGNRHIWDVWHGDGNYRNYLAHFPRMATEFGYHGPANYPTVEYFCPPDQRYWDSPILTQHNKNGLPGQAHTHARLHDDFNPPSDDFDAWHYLAQIVQARALSMGIEWFRALHPWNSGALYWQYNDCWPVSSWSALDGFGRPKPLWYATRRFFEPRLLTIKPRRPVPSGQAANDLAVYMHNDTDEAWAGEVTMRLLTLDGAELQGASAPLSVAARENKSVKIPSDWASQDPAATLLVAVAGDMRSIWWFAPDKQIDYPEARFDAELAKTASGYELTIRAASLLRDVCVYADRLDPDATVSDQCLTLLPGEQATLTIGTSRTMTLEALTTAPVFRCANAFGRGYQP